MRPPEEAKSEPTKNATPPTEPQESTPALSVTKEDSEVSTGRILSTPIARRMAEERIIDLSYISGSGPGGRITKNDVENYKPDNSDVGKPAEPSISAAPTSTNIVVSNADPHSETNEKQPIKGT